MTFDIYIYILNDFSYIIVFLFKVVQRQAMGGYLVGESSL